MTDMVGSWKDPKFASDYMQNAADVDMNWYEHSVNLASVSSMIPKGVKSLLDFGCGPGDFTIQLKEKGYKVDGCDGSQAMIELAQKHFKDINFFVWDGVGANPQTKWYDAIITKLTLHFVEDLSALAVQLANILSPKGSLIISVPHPIPTMSKADGVYLDTVPYDTEIGSYSMHVTMIHRSFQDYINPFLQNGFVITGFVEPSIPSDVIERYNVKKEYAQISRRLNIRFEKAGE